MVPRIKVSEEKLSEVQKNLKNDGHTLGVVCADLGINTSSGGKHTIQIAEQVEVQKFIEKIAPLKASEISF